MRPAACLASQHQETQEGGPHRACRFRLRRQGAIPQPIEFAGLQLGDDLFLGREQRPEIVEARDRDRPGGGFGAQAPIGIHAAAGRMVATADGILRGKGPDRFGKQGVAACSLRMSGRRLDAIPESVDGLEGRR
jgi:hypothetical protein